MSGTNNANNLGRESSNAANSVADGIGGVFKEVKGLGDEARGSFNQFADSLGDKIAGRDQPLPGSANNTETIAQGEKERAEGRDAWNRASAERNANSNAGAGAAPASATATATGTAPSATTGAGASGANTTTY